MRTERWRTGIAGGISLFLILAPLTHAQALVNTSGIANLAVTTPKIRNLAVTADKLGTAAVINAKIASRAVTANKIAFYSRVIVVAPSGGDFTSPVAAMNAITDASETNPYLVKIMPGVYDIGGGTVQMKPYVSIEGSGPVTTQIVGTQNTCLAPEDPTNPRPLYGVVTGSSNAGLRSLSVRNNGAAAGSCAVTAILAVDCDGMGIAQVGAQARGSNVNVGILVRSTVAGMDPVWITDSDAYAEGGTMSVGIGLRGETATTTEEAPGAAMIFNTAATAKGAPAGYNFGVTFMNALGLVTGGIANGDRAVYADGGSGLIQGTLLSGGVAVKNNVERPMPLCIGNSTGMEGGALYLDNGALQAANSIFAQSVSLVNGSTVTLLNGTVNGVTMDGGAFAAANSSIGDAVTVSGGAFVAANSSIGGAVTVSGGTFKAINSSLPANADNSGGGTTLCGGVVRTDTLATLDGTCQ